MEILFVLIPVSILFVALAIGIFSWAVKSGQYDDVEGPAHSILFDDDIDMIPGRDDKPKQKPEPEQIPSSTTSNKTTK